MTTPPRPRSLHPSSVGIAAPGSLDSVLAVGCVASVVSVGCIASLGSVGSIASLGSIGSVASIGSVGSIASTRSVGAVFNVPVAERIAAALGRRLQAGFDARRSSASGRSS